MTSVKRTTALFVGTDLTDAPSAIDFKLPGSVASIVTNIRAIAGTTPTIQVKVVELMNPRLSLPYNGQTVDFTVGARVTGGLTRATGIIVADTDGGATGTLELKQVEGRFRDDETITDDNGTPGVAVVNSATGGSTVYTEGGTWADSTALNSAGSVRTPINDPDAAADYRDIFPIGPEMFRLTFTAGGTITDLDFDVELVQSL